MRNYLSHLKLGRAVSGKSLPQFRNVPVNRNLKEAAVKDYLFAANPVVSERGLEQFPLGLQILEMKILIRPILPICHHLLYIKSM
jgi:hypothetical protein